ncbi:hypothetical protein ACFQ61_28255 [Streptomyces sp. NPDC056500]|uniref:hypothetical protein n=1 Tax=Streptomyces sp. NPDC056500 TaxID=3345840 RepID=UPI00367EFF9C
MGTSAARVNRRSLPSTWVEAARLMSRTAVGRSGGLTPQLARDAAAVLRAEESGGPAPSVRIAVLRRLPDPGVVALLSGHPVEGSGAPPTWRAGAGGGRGVLPLVVARAGDRSRLVIEAEPADALERLGLRFLGDRSLPPDTIAWLHGRGGAARPWFDIASDRETATLLWRRIQDMAGAVPDGDTAELEPFFAQPVSWLGAPSGRRTLLASTGAGTPVELVDVPCGTPGSGADTTGSVRRLVGSCHGVLLLFPAGALSTGAPDEAGPTVEWLRRWTEQLNALPHGPSMVPVATLDERSGTAAVPELAAWLSARLAVLLDGPRPRVHAIAVSEAHAVVGILAAVAGPRSGPGVPRTGPPGALLAQARADRVGSGLAALGDLVDSVVLASADGLAELTRRRLVAAFDDTRLGCRDTAFARRWPLDPLDGHTPWPDSGSTPASSTDPAVGADGASPQLGAAKIRAHADEMWTRLENDTVGLLAARAAGQGRRTRPSSAASCVSGTSTTPTPPRTSDARSMPTDPRPQGRKEDSP